VRGRETKRRYPTLPMNILVIHQQFLRPNEGGGSRFNEFSRLWSEAGHSVTVVAGQTSYATGKRSPEYRRHWVHREHVGDVTILRAYTPEAEMTSFVSRLWNFFCFMFSALWAVFLLAPKPDVIIATSPQLIVAVPGVLGAALRRCPLVFEVRDLWPETGITMGAIRKGSLFERALSWLEAWAYRKAAAINVLTPAFKDSIVLRGLAAPEKIWFIPNGADAWQRPDDAVMAEVRERSGWQAQFVALYAGAHGTANDLIQLVRAAEQLRMVPDVHLATVGSGAQLAQLRAEVIRRGLTNISFLGSVPKAEMPGILAAADVGVAVLKKCDTFKTVYPNKVFDYMSMRLPVLIAIDGIARELVEHAGAGIFVEPDDAKALARGVVWLRNNTEAAAEMGCKGERHVREHFDRAALAREYIQAMSSLLPAPKGGPGR